METQDHKYLVVQQLIGFYITQFSNCTDLEAKKDLTLNVFNQIVEAVTPGNKVKFADDDEDAPQNKQLNSQSEQKSNFDNQSIQFWAQFFQESTQQKSEELKAELNKLYTQRVSVAEQIKKLQLVGGLQSEIKILQEKLQQLETNVKALIEQQAILTDQERETIQEISVLLKEKAIKLISENSSQTPQPQALVATKAQGYCKTLGGDLHCAIVTLPQGRSSIGYVRDDRCYYSFGGIEHEAKEFKIFKGQKLINPNSKNQYPCAASQDPNDPGQKLWCAIVTTEYGRIPGKIHANEYRANYGFEGREYQSSEYQVVVEE